MNIETITKHLQKREYMSGVDRDKSRVKFTGEVYTPTELVQEIINLLPEDQFIDPTKTFLDPTCGDGQFLSEVVIRKVETQLKLNVEFDVAYKQALATTYGADLMEDNCLECIARLYMIDKKDIVTLKDNDIPENWRHEGLTAVFEVRDEICKIVCADGLLYDYNFGTIPDPIEFTGETKKKKMKAANTGLFPN